MHPLRNAAYSTCLTKSKMHQFSCLVNTYLKIGLKINFRFHQISDNSRSRSPSSESSPISDLFINKQFRTCANAFPNEFTVRLYEYWAGQHWILSRMEENQTATYFLRSGYLHMILWTFSTTIYLYVFLNQSLGLILGNMFSTISTSMSLILHVQLRNNKYTYVLQWLLIGITSFRVASGHANLLIRLQYD